MASSPSTWCAACRRSFIYPSDLRKHVSSFHERTKDKSCQYCDYLTTYAGSLASHVKRNHPEEERRERTCGECEHVAKGKNKLRLHVRAEHENKVVFTCPETDCGLQTTERRNLERHMENKHRQEDSEEMSSDPTADENVDALGEEADVKVDDDEPEEESQVFVPDGDVEGEEDSIDELREEEETEVKADTEQPYLEDRTARLRCKICGFSTPDAIEIQEHLIGQHSNSAFRNDQREATPTDDEHQPSDVPRRHQCDHCDYSTHRPHDLKRHVKRKHSGIGDDVVEEHGDAPDDPEKSATAAATPSKTDCPICGLEFSPSRVRAHIKSKHPSEAENAYKCGECDFSAGTAKRMEIHEREHSAYSRSRVRLCPLCGVSVGGHSRRHLERFHPAEADTAFRCADCDFGAPGLRQLKRHAKEAHGNSNFIPAGNADATFAQTKEVESEKEGDNNSEVEEVSGDGDGRDFSAATTEQMHMHTKNADGADVGNRDPVLHCPLCGVSFGRNARRHLRRHHPAEADTAFKCHDCTFAAPAWMQLKRHAKEVHGNTNCTPTVRQSEQVAEGQEGGNDSDIQDVDVEQEESNDREIQEVPVEDESALLRCSECDFSSKDGVAVQSHEEEVHGIYSAHPQSAIDLRKKAGEAKEAEVPTVYLDNSDDEEEKPARSRHYYPCPICLKKITPLYAHIKKVHPNEAPTAFKCETQACDYATDTRMALNKHRMEIHGERVRSTRKIAIEKEEEEEATTTSQQSMPQSPAKRMRTEERRTDLNDNDDEDGLSDIEPLEVDDDHMVWDAEEAIGVNASEDGAEAAVDGVIRTPAGLHACPNCPYSASRRSVVQRHMSIIHLKQFTVCCPLCAYKAGHTSDVYRHLAREHPGEAETAYKCGQCPFAASRSTAVKRHVKIVHNGKKELLCGFANGGCRFVSFSKAYLKKHHVKEHGQEPHAAAAVEEEKPNAGAMEEEPAAAGDMEEKPDAASDIEPEKRCPECEFSTDCDSGLYRHMRSQHPGSTSKAFACKACPFRALKPKELKLHKLIVHQGRSPHTCNKCGLVSASSRFMAQHVKKCSGGASNESYNGEDECEAAGKEEAGANDGDVGEGANDKVAAGNEESSVQEEPLISEDEIKQECDIKTEEEDEGEAEEEDVWDTEGVSMVQVRCKNCGFTCGGFEEMESHECADNIDGPRFACDREGCNYRASKKYGLDCHVKYVHDRVRDRRCPLCPDYAAARTSDVLKHLRNAHPEEAARAYKCSGEDCDYAAASLSKLKLHEKTSHKGKASLKCGSCKFAALGKKALEEHVTSVHGGRVKIEAVSKHAECPRCRFTAATDAEVTSHIMTVHVK